VAYWKSWLPGKTGRRHKYGLRNGGLVKKSSRPERADDQAYKEDKKQASRGIHLRELSFRGRSTVFGHDQETKGGRVAAESPWVRLDGHRGNFPRERGPEGIPPITLQEKKTGREVKGGASVMLVKTVSIDTETSYRKEELRVESIGGFRYGFAQRKEGKVLGGAQRQNPGQEERTAVIG